MAEHHRGNWVTSRRASRVGSPLWMGDVTRLLRENFAVGPAEVFLITVTAPGANRFPCSRETCGHKGKHHQRQADGCRVDPRAAERWNKTCEKRWSEVHRRARQRVRRQGHDLAFLARVFQMQARGLLHIHIAVGYEGFQQQTAAMAYVKALKELTPDYGFGFVDGRNRGDGSTVMARERAAHYLSPYLGSTAVSMAEQSQFGKAVSSRLVNRPVFVSHRLTAMTRCTMRNLRRVRFLYWIRRGRSVFTQAGRLPAWFRDPKEYDAIVRLLRVPEVAAAARAP
jgi:hypothetical protein